MRFSYPILNILIISAAAGLFGIIDAEGEASTHDQSTIFPYQHLKDTNNMSSMVSGDKSSMMQLASPLVDMTSVEEDVTHLDRKLTPNWSLEFVKSGWSTDYLGMDVALSAAGDRFVIGPHAYLSNYGKVEVYDLIDNTWTLVKEWVGDAPNNIKLLGMRVSISDDGKRVAAIYDKTIPLSGTFINGIIVWEETSSGVWEQVGNDIEISNFLTALRISGNGKRFVAGGADHNNSDQAGIVHVYEESNSVWSPIGSINGQKSYEQFGRYDVGMSYDGQTFIAGAPYIADGNEMPGAARVYQQLDNASGWEQVGSDITSYGGSLPSDRFGRSVDMSNDGTRVVIGDSGKKQVQIFNLVGDSEWQAEPYYFFDPNGSWVGTSCSISNDGNAIAVGSINNLGTAVATQGASGDWFAEYNFGPESFSTVVSLSGDGKTVGIGNTWTDTAAIYKAPSTTFDCNDSPLLFRFKKPSSSGGGRITGWKTCANWVAQNPAERCFKINKKSCPETCGTCEKCKDSRLKFKIEVDGEVKKMKCDDVAMSPAEFCEYDGVPETCRETCKDYVNYQLCAF